MHGIHRFTWDFYVLGFEAFDILLGIDWLRKFEAVISCKTRTVSLIDDKSMPLVVKGKSPQEYAGSFIFSLDSHPNDLSSTSVVQLFSDVFGESILYHLRGKSNSASTIFLVHDQ